MSLYCGYHKYARDNIDSYCCKNTMILNDFQKTACIIAVDSTPLHSFFIRSDSNNTSCIGICASRAEKTAIAPTTPFQIWIVHLQCHRICSENAYLEYDLSTNTHDQYSLFAWNKPPFTSFTQILALFLLPDILFVQFPNILQVPMHYSGIKYAHT